MQVLYFDDCQERQDKFKAKFPLAYITNEPGEAVFALSTGHYDIICINIHKLMNPNTYEEFYPSDDILNFIMTYFPVIKRIWLHGDDFEQITKYRQALQAAGYPAIYMPFPAMMTFTNP